VIAAATSGVITIQDGKEKREILLAPAQIRGGSLLYSPTSDQIQMQLSVTTPANTVTESVMVVVPQNGSSHVYPLASSQSSSAAPADAPAQKVEQAKASKPFVEPPATRTALPPAPVLTDAPPSSPAFHPATTGTPGIVAQVLPPLPPPVVKAPEPASANPSQQLPSKIVPYQPAAVISKAAPSFPAELGSLAVQRKVIEVTVSIDKNGRVSKAEAVPQKNVNQFFINSALNAARLWKFRPAMRGDEPVASEMVLQFIFGN
jgi:protein TonB